MKKEEPEMVSMGVATPKSGMDTIKRAEMRVADTDSYKGHVHKLPDNELVRWWFLFCLFNFILLRYLIWRGVQNKALSDFEFKCQILLLFHK